MNNLLITICARGGSRGIPGKNIRPIAGTPLIVYSIRHALTYAKKIGADIELSTDSDDIKKVAADAGLKTEYQRPAALSTDLVGKLDTIQHVVRDTEKRRGKTYDMILDLDVTSPLRTIEDLDAARKMMDENPKARNLFSVSFPKHNPYFDMVEPNAEGFYELVKKPTAQMTARQQGPRVYELNASFYYYRRAFFEESPLVLMRNSLAYVMPHMCFELDDMEEFALLEYLITQQKLDFPFS